MASDDGSKIRKSATRTEVLTSIDLEAQSADAKSEALSPALVVVQGEMMGRVFRIPEGRVSIGRHPNCEIPVHQRAVSGFHAELRRSGDQVQLEDLKSTNGTMVNRQKVLPSHPKLLAPGDLIRVGTTFFKYIDNQLDAAFSESLHNQVTRDALTGVFNRAYVMRALESSIEVAKSGFPLSLVVIDLDHFKKINDGFGHLAGDFVLKEACRVLLETVVRSDDVLGRYGGEEFIVILPDSSLEVALGVAERIRSTIQDHVFEFEGKKIPVTTSVGVHDWSANMSTAEDLISKTDQLLYEAKKSGRNRVVSPPVKE